MSWFSKIFSKIGVNVISSVGKVLDDLTTSDEELALTDIQKKKITVAYNVRMQELMLDIDRQAADHERKMEGELTERLRIDMKSDSWLSKNIRPIVLIFMTGVVSALSFATIFTSGLSDEQLQVIDGWIPFFQTIMTTLYSFYFGSRGIEKIQKIRSSSDAKSFQLGQEPRG